MQNLLEIIYEDEEFLVINKPAGLVCHPTKTDEYSSLVGRVRLYLGGDYRPQLINRLDRETSGITVVAKDLDAARTIRRLWEQRQVEKEYLAIVHGRITNECQVITASLGKDEQSTVAIKDCVRPDGVAATTRFWLHASFVRFCPLSGAIESRSSEQDRPEGEPRSFSLLRVVPLTGRKHQIRIHLAHIGHPIVGDKLYGGDEDLYLALVENRLSPGQQSRLMLPYQALHASELRFDWRSEERVFRAEPEPWFKAFCSSAALRA